MYVLYFYIRRDYCLKYYCIIIITVIISIIIIINVILQFHVNSMKLNKIIVYLDVTTFGYKV